MRHVPVHQAHNHYAHNANACVMTVCSTESQTATDRKGKYSFVMIFYRKKLQDILYALLQSILQQTSSCHLWLDGTWHCVQWAKPRPGSV